MPTASAVPTNLVTGFLGVGKTTALMNLLRTRPPGSRWAVLVNEYGEVGIDQALLEDAATPGVTIKEVAGGCICCTSSVFFKFALAQILTHVKPERVLVETTGVGHPSRLIDMLRLPVYGDRISLRATVCLIDPHDFDNSEMRNSPVFLDQVELADVLLLNKADLASDATKQAFQKWGKSLFPPKLHVGVTREGHLEPEWLDLDCSPERKPLFPDLHSEEEHRHYESEKVLLPEKGRPIRKESVAAEYRACGWLFSPEEVFDESKLLTLLGSDSSIRRLKGVFRTQDGWIVVNRVHQDVTVKPTQYRLDSRLEVFSESTDWGAFEENLREAVVRDG
jgi:G3E family GTPase